MAIPKYFEFFAPVMECLLDEKEHSTKDIRNYCVSYYSITEEELQERLTSGQYKYSNRIAWAEIYLKNAGLIESPSRSKYIITTLGKQAAKNGVQNITLEYLTQFESFRQFKGEKEQKSIANSIDNSTCNDSESPELSLQDPQEQLDTISRQLNESLAINLMQKVLKMSPYDFEKLVVQLLEKMGYGEPSVTKKSGDAGIDGSIKADKFGFDTIYVQAKQWKLDSTVSRPEIQKFLGALVGKGASKGLFITTAKYSNEAIQLANQKMPQKIVLVDGDMLIHLMIEYNLGVHIETIYEFKQINDAFFDDDD